jgi:hypothetical protein
MNNEETRRPCYVSKAAMLRLRPFQNQLLAGRLTFRADLPHMTSILAPDLCPYADGLASRLRGRILEFGQFIAAVDATLGLQSSWHARPSVAFTDIGCCPVALNGHGAALFLKCADNTVVSDHYVDRMAIQHVCKGYVCS